MTGFNRMLLEWRRPWLILWLTLFVLGSLGLTLQYLRLLPILQAHHIALFSDPCAQLTQDQCTAFLNTYSQWLGATFAWLVRQGALSPLGLGLGGLAALLGLLGLLAAVPKANDRYAAALRLQARAEGDPWAVRFPRRLWIPRIFGRFWASGDDLRDLMPPYQPGAAGRQVYLGKWGGEPLAIHPGWGGKAELDHLLLVAPNGSGKGMLIKSVLCDYRGSSVVSELKGEFYAELGGYLKTRGHQVLVLSCDGKGNRFDPFLEFPDGLGLQAAAKLLIKGGNASATRDDKNAIFGDRAAILLNGALIAARKLGLPTLPYLAHIYQGGLRDFALALYRLGEPEVTRKITGFLADPPEAKNWDDAARDRFIQSCWGNFVTKIEPLLDPGILAMCGGSDFRAEDLRAHTATLFLHFPKESQEATWPLFQLVQEAVIRGLTQKGHDTATARARPILLIEDEAHALVPPNAAQHINTIRAWGLQKLLVLQSRSQLVQAFGEAGAEAVEAGCLTQMYYRPADLITPKYISERAGHMPYPEESQSHGEGGHQSLRFNLGSRPLIRPEGVLELSDDQIILFPRGRPPVAAHRLFPTDLETGREAYALEDGRLKPRFPGPALACLKPPLIRPEQLVLAEPEEGHRTACQGGTEGLDPAGLDPALEKRIARLPDEGKAFEEVR